MHNIGCFERQFFKVYLKTNIAYCFFKMGQPLDSFFVYFWSFQTNIITIFTTNMCEKCPFSMRCWDLNLRPLQHEPPPITTRPGLSTTLLIAE